MNTRVAFCFPILLLAVSLIVGPSLTSAQPKPPPAVTLSVDQRFVAPCQAVTLAWSSTNANSASISPDIGDVPTSGSIVLHPCHSTTYAITVRGEAGEASAGVMIMVAPPTPAAVPPPPTAPDVALRLVTGRAFLVDEELETVGYGLYSYVLFGSPPNDATRERYLKAVQAYLGLTEIQQLEQYFIRLKLNITYLPVRTRPEESSESVLEQYNYARAQALLGILPGSHQDGPYLLSSLRPLSRVGSLSGRYLFQDLSFVPPSVVGEWVKEFQRDVAQRQFWKMAAVRRLTLDLRTAVAILAIGLPNIQDAVKGWIVSKD